MDALAPGTRIEYLDSPRGLGSRGLRRRSRGTVQATYSTLMAVRWDSGLTEPLWTDRDRYREIGETEQQERERALRNRFLRAGARVRIVRRGSLAARQETKLNWRGEIEAIDNDQLLRVRFDKSGSILILDPLVDEFVNITGEENRLARLKVLRKLALGPGDVLELTADIEDEPKLRAGMRFRVDRLDSEATIQGDWEGVQLPQKLLPDRDPIRVVERAESERFGLDRFR